MKAFFACNANEWTWNLFRQFWKRKTLSRDKQLANKCKLRKTVQLYLSQQKYRFKSYLLRRVLYLDRYSCIYFCWNFPSVGLQCTWTEMSWIFLEVPVGHEVLLLPSAIFDEKWFINQIIKFSSVTFCLSLRFILFTHPKFFCKQGVPIFHFIFVKILQIFLMDNCWNFHRSLRWKCISMIRQFLQGLVICKQSS